MKTLTEKDRITFGKYKGQKISDILIKDPVYLKFLQTKKLVKLILTGLVLTILIIVL